MYSAIFPARPKDWDPGNGFGLNTPQSTTRRLIYVAQSSKRMTRPRSNPQLFSHVSPLSAQL